MKDVYVKVKQILEEQPDTRDSDELLYIELCKMLNPTACAVSMLALFRDRAFYGIPTVETVTRARRKIQHDNPELQPSVHATERRYEHYKRVRKELGYDV